MPHKHKRKRDGDGDYELPPSRQAQPLAVGNNKQAASVFTEATNAKRSKKRKASKENDIPKGFRRVMAMASGKRLRSGLDNGQQPGSKGATTDDNREELKIRPGEDFRSFSARVDAALPVTGLAKKTATKDGKDALGFKVWRTTKERKMHKLYDEWREEERKIQDKKAEALDEAAEQASDTEPSGLGQDAHGGGVPGKRKRKQAKEEDPWAVLKTKRAETKAGLHDVAQAPPELHKKNTRRLQVRDSATVDVGNIPKGAGSLRRREELQSERESVLEAYRKIREHEQKKLSEKQKH